MSALLPPAVHAVTYVPRPAPVPDTELALAYAIAFRVDTAAPPVLRARRIEAREATTVRPGAAS